MVNLRSTEDIISALMASISFLKSSCESFDAGNMMEYLRMSAEIYKLVHNENNNAAILDQAKLLDKMKFISTGRIEKDNGLRKAPLTLLRVCEDGAHDVIAKMDQGPPGFNMELSFPKWWSERVLAGLTIKGFSRKNLIFRAANTDGGRHLSDKITDLSFEKIKRGSDMAMHVEIEGKKKLIPSPFPYTIRQISHEVLKSISLENIIPPPAGEATPSKAIFWTEI